MNFLGGLLRITVPIGPLDTIDNLASVHSYFYNRDYQDSQSKIIDNISNTLTDMCVANHAAILLVSESWDKTLNKLNCHLHPLDSIALKTRSASKECEDTLALKKTMGKQLFCWKHCYGNEYFKIQRRKRRSTWLCNIPGQPEIAQRGNRLHILFHICGVFIQH